VEELVAFLDESGIDYSSRIVAVAGILASRADWEVFSNRWKALLSNAGVDSMHMRLFEESRGPYQHLDREQRAALQGSLIDLMNESVFGMVACCIIRGDPENRSGQFQENLEQPYSFCVGDVMTALLRKADAFIDPTVDFICGDQRELRKGARDQYHSMRADPDFAFLRSRFGTVEFLGAKDERAVPLQAADIVAYEVRKAGLNLQEGRPERASYRRLRGGGKLRLHHADRQGLEDLARKYLDGEWPKRKVYGGRSTG
jgi:Protein of unknown function (DUF3800)